MDYVPPMPLKHDIETWLIFLLGLCTVLAGIVCAFLPPISVALWPWAIAFGLSLLYPFALFPYLKERRADNAFRILHFAPAVILFLWLVSDLVAGMSPRLDSLQQFMTWHGGVLPIFAVLFLLVLFTLSVIRQRKIRLILLGLLLLLLISFGSFNNRYHWDSFLAARLWGHSGSILAIDSTMSGSTTSVAETHWRAQLRLMEERRRAIAAGRGTGAIALHPNVHGSKSGVVIASQGVSSAGPSMPPPHLPHAGPTADVLVFLTMSGFTAAVHRRTMQRRSIV